LIVMILLDVLKSEFIKDLPGKDAQYRMAPEGRVPDATPSVKKNAAVSIILVSYPANLDWEIILIKRPEYNGPHSDQVGFPGGKEEKSDCNLIDTAIRECYEEIGLHLRLDNMVGTLTPLYIPVSQYLVYPYVFIYDQVPNFNTASNEVSYIIQFPVSRLLEETIRQETTLEIRNQKLIVPYYAINKEVVWGATAMILSEFIEIVKSIKMQNPGLI
jgi:8-oxo-dGTP pyrophosphatase MutT (NUDIX family)